MSENKYPILNKSELKEARKMYAETSAMNLAVLCVYQQRVINMINEIVTPYASNECAGEVKAVLIKNNIELRR